LISPVAHLDIYLPLCNDSSLEFEPKIATHKMNQSYRSPRYKTQDVIDIVRDKVVIDADVGAALEALLRLDVIKKHIAGKTTRQTQEFQL
jgi:hypothetical protein